MAKEMTEKRSFEEFEALIREAEAIAGQAAEDWLRKALKAHPHGRYTVHSEDIVTGELSDPIGVMLDLCGNAIISFRDKRDAFYKHCKAVEIAEMEARGQEDRVKYYQGPHSLFIRHKYSGRQEMGLNCAAKEAALNFLRANGIKNLGYREYVD